MVRHLALALLCGACGQTAASHEPARRPSFAPSTPTVEQPSPTTSARPRIDLGDRTGWRSIGSTTTLMLRDETGASLDAIGFDHQPTEDEIARQLGQASAVKLGGGSPRSFSVTKAGAELTGMLDTLQCGKLYVLLIYIDMQPEPRGARILHSARCLAPDEGDVVWPRS